MLKILQINKFFYLRGGSERYMFELSRLLEDKGHRVIHFSMQDARNLPSPYEKYFAKPVNVNRFSFKDVVKNFYNWDAVYKLDKLIKAEKPDIAHLHNIANHLSPAIVKVLKKNGLPVVQTLHDYKLVCPNRQLFNRGKICRQCEHDKFYKCFLGKCIQDSRGISLLGSLEAYLHIGFLKSYKQVDLFLAPSLFMKETVASFGIPEANIKVINNFVPPDFCTRPAEISRIASGKTSYLLYFGRLSQEKGLEVLLAAMGKTSSGGMLKIAGAGPDFKKIKIMIENNGLGEKVEILGPKYGEELRGIICGAQAVVMPSLWLENFPYSLLEAMALGKAVIASEVGGIPEIIKDRENGLLFSAGRSDELAAKIDMLKNINLNDMGAKARTIVEKFNQEKHYNELLNVYKGILNIDSATYRSFLRQSNLIKK